MTSIRLAPAMCASLGFLLVLSSCATGGAGGPEACRSDLAPHGRSLNELVDSTALQAELQSIWVPVDGLVLGWFHFDSTGARDGTEIYTESLSEAQRERMEEALDSAVVEGPGRRNGTNIFLGDESGPAVRRLARVQACRPEIVNRDDLSRAIETGGGQLGIRARREVVLMALVLPDGTVGEVQVDRSSGDHQIDLLAVTVARSAEFRPAVIEGMRVRFWTRFPVTFHPGSGGKELEPNGP